MAKRELGVDIEKSSKHISKEFYGYVNHRNTIKNQLGLL